MHVTEILDRKGTEVATVAPDQPVSVAVAQLDERSIGALLVSSDGTTIEGILSERDVVRHIARQGRELLDAPIRSIMTAQVRTCTRSDTVSQLMELMTEHRIRHLPVVDGSRLAGMISIGDVVKWRVSELEAETEHLESYISGAGYT